MSPLTKALAEVVSKLFPAVSFDSSLEFRPLFDLSKGDISSSVAIHIAREVRGEANEIATQISQQLPFIPGAEWRCERGYVILAGAPPARLLCEEAAAMQCGVVTGPLRVGLLLPDVTVPLYARLRLIACVGFQALCAVAVGAPCEVVVIPGKEVKVRSPHEVAQAIQHLVGLAIQRCNDKHLANESDVVHLKGCVTVWTAHHFYDRLPRPTRDRLAELRDLEGVDYKMPPDGWLLARDRGLSEILSSESVKGVLARLTSEEHWLRWILHLSSSIPSGDLDPAVVLYDELASPRWGLQALWSRLQQLSGAGAVASFPMLGSAPADVTHEALEKFRPLLLRTIFLAVWVKLAAFEGRVLEGVTAIEEFTRDAHGFLNSPAVRLALHQGGGADEEIVQIVAGITFALSSIIPLGSTSQPPDVAEGQQAEAGRGGASV